MKEISNYWKALTFAAKNHGIKTRKDNETPYVIHPMRITAILRAAGFSEFKNEDLMMAALFHDLIEDTETSLNDIKNQFGKKSASIVEELTKPEDDDKGSKEKWLKSFDKASKEAKIIKMADRIDNLMDMNLDIWPIEKQKSYAEQGKIILEKCGDAHSELAIKLKSVINKILEN